MFSFDDVLGLESAKSHLLSAAFDNKVSHAYIFSGEDGSGKMMLAERFAATLQCDSPVASGPCCMCINCMQAESHNHPDIIYVSHSKKNILVDDIRNQLINDITIKPYSGRYKIYIIDEAEKMNEAAQNALLKTLEEPPEYAVIILLATNTGAFLQTILSRCVIIEMKPVPTAAIRDLLMRDYHLPDYISSLCASFSCGCIGKAIRYATDESFTSCRSHALKLVQAERGLSVSDTNELIAFLSNKENAALIDDFFDLIRLWFRDVLMYKSSHNDKRVIFAEEISSISSQAGSYTYERLNSILEAVELTKTRLSTNVSVEGAVRLLISAITE